MFKLTLVFLGREKVGCMWYNNNVQSQELTFRGFWKLDLPFCILLVQSWNENSKSPTTEKNESNFMWSNTCFPHLSVQVEKVSSHTQKVMETSKDFYFPPDILPWNNLFQKHHGNCHTMFMSKAIEMLPLLIFFFLSFCFIFSNSNVFSVKS